MGNKDKIDQALKFLQSCDDWQLKYIYGNLSIGRAAADLRKTVKTDAEFFAKIQRPKMSEEGRQRFLTGTYDYNLKDIATLEAWRSEVLQKHYVENAVERAAKDATIIHTYERAKKSK
jgi:hypothetical protein